MLKKKRSLGTIDRIRPRRRAISKGSSSYLCSYPQIGYHKPQNPKPQSPYPNPETPMDEVRCAAIAGMRTPLTSAGTSCAASALMTATSGSCCGPYDVNRAPNKVARGAPPWPKAEAQLAKPSSACAFTDAMATASSADVGDRAKPPTQCGVPPEFTISAFLMVTASTGRLPIDFTQTPSAQNVAPACCGAGGCSVDHHTDVHNLEASAVHCLACREDDRPCRIAGK